MEAIVFIIFRNTGSLRNWGMIFHRFSQVTCLDKSRLSKSISWIITTNILSMCTLLLYMTKNSLFCYLLKKSGLQRWTPDFFTAMITLHFRLIPQYKYELFHIYFTWFHCTGRNELNKLTLLPMCGFIAQLVEHHTGIAEVMGSNPVEALIFFRLLLSNCLNWKIYSDDHSSLSFLPNVVKFSTSVNDTIT